MYKECNFIAAMAGAKQGVDRHGRAPKKGRAILYKALSEDQQHGNVDNQPIPRRTNKVPKKLVKARVAKLVVPADSEGGANIHGQR